MDVFTCATCLARFARASCCVCTIVAIAAISSFSPTLEPIRCICCSKDDADCICCIKYSAFAVKAWERLCNSSRACHKKGLGICVRLSMDPACTSNTSRHGSSFFSSANRLAVAKDWFCCCCCVVAVLFAAFEDGKGVSLTPCRDARVCTGQRPYR